MGENRVAIITGSTRGIGKSIAKLFIERNISVVVNGRKQESVEQTVKELQQLGGKVIGLAGPVENPATGEALVKLALQTFGRVDILINNAGIIRDHLAVKMSHQDFFDVINVHVNGTFYCTKPFITALKNAKLGGFLINMTSTAGIQGTIGQVNYSAAKAAICGMTWTLAKELINDEIQVHAIAPAAVTDMTKPYIERAKQQAAKRKEPLPSYWEIGSPDDVAAFIWKLIQKKDMSTSGEIYGVNGSHVVHWNPMQAESKM